MLLFLVITNLSSRAGVCGSFSDRFFCSTLAKYNATEHTHTHTRARARARER